MSLSGLSIKRPVTTVMIILIVIIFGGISLSNLKQDLMPELELGYVVVMADYDGAGPQEVETLVTAPLEAALGTVNNLQNISSTSSNGSAVIVLEFSEGTNMDSAALKIRENIDLVKQLIPQDVEPRILQINPNTMQSYTLGVTGSYDLERLKSIVDDEIAGRLKKLDGVASVNESGGREREISIELFPDKLSGFGITATQIAGVLAAENINLPGGQVSQGDFNWQVRTTGEFRTIREIESLPLAIPTGQIIRLCDVANVVDGYKKINSSSNINGKPGIMLSILKQSTANTVEVSDRINKELSKMHTEYPALEFTVIQNPSQFIKIALFNVWESIFMATALAVVVLLLFLGGIRSSVIIGVAIPISIITTMMLSYFADLTLNMITLNALVISVGMLVDNSIVVLECINRHFAEGKSAADAARDGANEVAMPVFASTLTTVVVFVPVIFVEGIAGKVFAQIGLILTFSLLSSLAVSLTFVPMACSKFLRSSANKTVPRGFRKKWDGVYGKMEEGYSRLLKWAVYHKRIVVAVFILLMVVTASAIPFMGMEFMESMDRGTISIQVKTPQGTSFDEISAITDKVVGKLESVSEIQDITVTVGGSSLLAAVNGSGASATVLLNLIPKNTRPSVDDTAEKVRTAIGFVAGAEVTVASGAGSLLGGNSVSLYLYGDDPDVLAQTGEEATMLISAIPNIRNADNSMREGLPQIRVMVDRNKASMYGFQAANIANTVNLAINGRTVTRYKLSANEIDITLRYLPERVKYISDLRNMILVSPTGTNVPLYEIAAITEESGPTSITKENNRRHITISADYMNSNLNTVKNDIEQQLDGMVFADGVSYKFGGTFETMMESFNSLGSALIIGFILVYMVIASQFESFIYPVSILFSIPVAWTSGILGLFLFGNSISIISMVGLILLMGVVVNNGIVLVDYINVKRRDGLEIIDAILYVGPVRLRPILMTTITTVAGLLPMLFANGEGSEIQKPLGAVITVGLTVSTFVTLILIPVLYLILDGLVRRTTPPILSRPSRL